MSDAIETTLGEVLEIKYGKDHKKLADGKIPLYGSGGIMRYVEKALYNKPSILIPRKGSLDNLFYEENPFWTVDTLFWTKIDENKVDPKYLFYLLSLYKLSKYDEGSAVPSLTTKALNDVPIAFPRDKNEQIAIRKIIDNLDKKITLLRQQNQDLEELAQTLFKRWFVEFEFPVCLNHDSAKCLNHDSLDFQDNHDFNNSKNQGNQSNPKNQGSDIVTYKSSGGNMVESELGEIPEGWMLSNLAELAENKAKTYKFTKKEVVFINTGDVLEGKFLHKNYLNPEGLPGQAKKALELNDILYSEIRPKNKRFAFVDFDASDYVVSTKFMIIKTKGEIHAHILYLILKEENSIVKINHIAEARSGTFPQITFDSISDFEILKAPLKVQDKFMDLLLPTMGKQKNNEQEIQTLIQLRDTLLPKLMSGELRVK